MRMSRTYLVAALAAIGALGVSGIAIAAPGDIIQTLDASLSPSKLPKSDFQNVKLNVTVSGCYEGSTPGQCREETPKNPDAERVLIGFDRRDMAFNSGEAKQCKVSRDQIATMPPDQAKSACGRDSVIGKGSATALALNGTPLPATVTVFNGKKSGGRPHVWLHAFVSQANTGTVVDSALKPGNKWDIRVDPLLGGNARLQKFSVGIKKGAYVQGRCSDKKITTTSKWTYRANPSTGEPQQTAAVNDTQKCTVKR